MFKQTFSLAIAATLIAVMPAPKPVLANGLGENRPFQFRSPNDRAARLRQLELQELAKDGTFFSTNPDSAGATPASGNAAGAAGDAAGAGGTTINCFVTSTTTGNTSTNGITGTSGGLTGIDTPNLNADSQGNAADSSSGEGGSVASDQSNTGGQAANVDNNSFSSGEVGTFDSGDANNSLDNVQDVIDGTLTASVETSSGCGDFVLN